jgi:hypothetical protein
MGVVEVWGKWARRLACSASLWVGACLTPNPAWNDAETADAETAGTVESTSTAIGSTGEPDPTKATGPDPDATSMGESTSGPDPTTGAIWDSHVIKFGDRQDADVRDAGRDTYVRGSAPTMNAGIHYDMHLEGRGTVALLHWDITAIPAGARIVEAELMLVTVDGFQDTLSFEVFDVREPWVEGDQNEAPGWPNWQEREPGVPWGSEGVGPGTRGLEAWGSFEGDQDTEILLVDLDPRLLQAWVDDPASNHGMALVPGLASDGWVMSREFEVTVARPMLTVTYETEPSS